MKNFPVEISGFPSLLQLAAEGRATNQSTGPISTQITTATVNFGASLAGIKLTVTTGRAFIVTSIAASAASGPVQAYSSSNLISKVFGSALAGQVFSGIDTVFGANGGSICINPLVLIGSEGSVDVNFKSLMPNGSTPPYVSATIHGIDITADFNFSAKKKIMWIGESTSWGSMETDSTGVAFPGEALAPFVVTNFMRRNGKSVRLINKAFGGMSSNNMEYARRSGFYDISADLYVINMGVNDASAAVSQTTYKANLANMIKHRNTFNPTAPIIFVSCYPTDFNVANYRTWMQDVANDTSAGGGTVNNVYFLDGTTSFALNGTPSLDTNFAVSNRSTGNRVHYSGLGQALNAAVITNALSSYPWYNNF